MDVIVVENGHPFGAGPDRRSGGVDMLMAAHGYGGGCATPWLAEFDASNILYERWGRCVV